MNPFSVIIPSRNFRNLRACVAALHRNGAGRRIVIDDGLAQSGYEADSAEYDRGACLDGATIIPGVKPFIFARNINLGIVAAGTDDVILLNDDALLVTPNGFTLLAETAAAHPECGLMSVVTNGASLAQLPHPGSGVRYERVMVAFVCVFIPRSTIDKIGLLDERFGLRAEATSGPRGYGCDDDDYCWRVRAAGLKLGIFDGCFVDHRSLTSTFRGDPSRPADVLIHEALFQQKWGRHPRNP